MWKIGNVLIKTHVVLAPMSGITSLGYREFLKKFGIGYSVTEMVNDVSVINHNKKALEIIRTSELDRPVAIQLFGNKINSTLKAIDIINNELNIDYDFLDINLGCPVKKIVKNNSGAAWLNDTEKLYDYINSIVKHSIKPVTTKIRIGFDEKKINVFEVVDILIKAGVSAIAIHARTAKQKYSGKANFELLKSLGKKMSVPLIISGDIFSINDAINALKITNATAVMVARGAVGNPHLITQINYFFEKKIKLDDLNYKDNIKNCFDFIDFIKNKNYLNNFFTLKKIVPYFFSKAPGAKKIRSELVRIKNFEDLNKILLKFK